MKNRVMSNKAFLTINDRVYGQFSVSESILIDLIESPAIQRLKQINQLGMPQRFYPYPGFSRYEHSVGVMLLLKKLNADLEEQIAGLVHDVSHTAFSHIVDWVIGDREKEDHQDKNLEKIISASTIPDIVKRYGFEPDKVTDIEKYGLLERPAPQLCADRIDYALREFSTWADPEGVNGCAKNLIVYNGQIVFAKRKIAARFAQSYAKCQREHWGGAECTVRWELLSRALKTALKEEIIKLDDFYSDDEHIINRLVQSRNTEIGKVLDLLKTEKLKLRENQRNPEFNLKKKFRYVDPHYTENGTLHVLSESIEYQDFLKGQRAINERRIKVDLIA